ncbi:uncharacterized protein RAG0_13091 [Rhynchosporium agropyri]|uniref:Uncharacterized protein n=1 Tax=Rhynchosporium agropyri TaxID=914238 RepID=A0A1E1LBK8_9HELO|nr:uncharacterized protein RAG0_13091 [Rhynchosporium agropyri]
MTMTMTMTTSPSTPQAQGRFPRSQGCGCIQGKAAGTPSQASSLTVYCTSSKRYLYEHVPSRRIISFCMGPPSVDTDPGVWDWRQTGKELELARAGQPDIDVALVKYRTYLPTYLATARLTIRHTCPALTGSLSQSAADVFHDPIYVRA